MHRARWDVWIRQRRPDRHCAVGRRHPVDPYWLTMNDFTDKYRRIVSAFVAGIIDWREYEIRADVLLRQTTLPPRQRNRLHGLETLSGEERRAHKAQAERERRRTRT
jgi:hypothetical protein